MSNGKRILRLLLLALVLFALGYFVFVATEMDGVEYEYTDTESIEFPASAGL